MPRQRRPRDGRSAAEVCGGRFYSGDVVAGRERRDGFGVGGVFKQLNKVQPGDMLSVQTKKGLYLHFVVIQTTTYTETAVPLDQLFGLHDSSRLNLITCEGMWNPEKRRYDHRLVVYTKLVPPQENPSQ